MSAFTLRIREFREARGLSLYKLAQLTGISKQGVLNLEAEGADPKLSTLAKVANALEVPLADLVVHHGVAARVKEALVKALDRTNPALTVEQVAKRVRARLKLDVSLHAVAACLQGFQPSEAYPYYVEKVGDRDAARYRLRKVKDDAAGSPG